MKNPSKRKVPSSFSCKIFGMIRRISNKVTIALLMPLLMAGCNSAPEKHGHRIEYPELTNMACSHEYGGKVTRITQSLKLPDDCVLRDARFIISDVQDVVFDGNNAVIESSAQTIAVMVSTHDSENPTRRITVKNLQINGYGTAVRVHRYMTDDDLAKLKTDASYYDYLRATSTQYVTFDNLKIIDSQGSGFYSWVGNSHVTFKNSVIAGAWGPGLYLDTATSHNVIQNNVFIDNGYRKNNGKLRCYFGQCDANREHIAIDGSQNNLIEGNEFYGAAQGGISLYKNCYEKHSTDPTGILRPFHASYNTIRNNKFSSKDWSVNIGERMDRNLSSWDCGDPVYFGGKYYLDNPQYNVVTGNTGRGPVLVKGDNNTVTDNGLLVLTGSKIRSANNDPVSGNMVHGND